MSRLSPLSRRQIIERNISFRLIQAWKIISKILFKITIKPDNGSFGIIAQTKTIAESGSAGNDIFQSTAEFDSFWIFADWNTKLSQIKKKISKFQSYRKVGRWKRSLKSLAFWPKPPTVDSQNWSLATSLAIFAPIKTETSIPRPSRISSEIRPRPASRQKF